MLCPDTAMLSPLARPLSSRRLTKLVRVRRRVSGKLALVWGRRDNWILRLSMASLDFNIVLLLLFS